MDDIDRAHAQEESRLAAQVSNIRNQAQKRELVPVGSCYYCQSPVRSGHLFCDAECRDDWEQEKAARQRAGMSR